MTVVDLYTIQIVMADQSDESDLVWFDLPALMSEMEENLTDLLPAGYRARIRRWDHPGNEGDEDE